MMFLALGYAAAWLKDALKFVLPYLLCAAAGACAWQEWWAAPRIAGLQKTIAQVKEVTASIQRADQLTIDRIRADQAALGDRYAKDKASADARFASVERELLDSRSRLKAAESAPAECRSYAAPPTQLSGADAALALGIAKQGDDAIRQLGLCQAEYSSLVDKLNAEAAPTP